MIWIVVIVGFVLCGIVSGICSEFLVYRLKKDNPKDWAACGSPITWYYRPFDGPFIQGMISSRRFYWSLLIWTPVWMDDDITAGRVLIAFRASFFCCLLIVVGFFVTALLLS